MEPTITYVLEVCGDGLGILSGNGGHAVIRTASTPDGLSVQPVELADTLTGAWLLLEQTRITTDTTTHPRLTE